MGKLRASALLAGMLVIALPGLLSAANGPTSGAGVTATIAWAGTTCKNLQFWPDDAEQGWTEVKIKRPATGDYNGISLTVTGNSLDWSYSELYAVIVKGGANAYVYNYSLASQGEGLFDVGDDTGLVAPINPRNIQQVIFCLEGEDV